MPHHAAFPVHPFTSERFDAIFSMEVLYYLPAPDAALRTIHDLLVPGGRFACVLELGSVFTLGARRGV